MATNFRNSAGTDFDDLFDPYVTGTVPPNTGFRTSDGVDLAGRYAPLSYGSKRADVNYQTSAGTDLSNLWAQKGSAIYTLGFDGKSYTASGIGTESVAAIRLTIAADGTWTVARKNTIAGSFVTLASGTWLSAGGVASDYQVQFGSTTLSYTNAPPTTTNDAPSYVSASTTRAITTELSGGTGSESSATGTMSCWIRRGTGAATQSTLTCVLTAN